MWPNRNGATVRFAATFAQITDEFLARIELRLGRLIAVEIAHQTDSKGDIVQIIAVDVAAVNLSSPSIAHFDFAVATRRPIPNYEMIGQSVHHPPDMPVIIIEHSRVALAGPAIVNHDEFPAIVRDRRAPNFFDN